MFVWNMFVGQFQHVGESTRRFRGHICLVQCVYYSSLYVILPSSSCRALFLLSVSVACRISLCMPIYSSLGCSLSSFVPDIIHHRTYHGTFFLSNSEHTVPSSATMWPHRVTAATFFFSFLKFIYGCPKWLAIPHCCIVLVCLLPCSVLCKLLM